jgi:N-dimethylarginine dimethylaminohydrolase
VVKFNEETVAERCSFPLAIRDFYMVAGRDILLTYGSYANRYFEDWHMYELFMELHSAGAGFESMPKPPSFNHPEYANRKSQGCDTKIITREDQIINKLYQTKTLTEARSLSLKYDQRFMIYRTYLKDTLAFHAAGVAHCGDTLIRTRCGSQRGCDWFDSWARAKGFKVSALDYINGHIDGQVSLIRPGLMIADQRFYQALKDHDHPLAKWDCITVDYDQLGQGLNDMDQIIQTGNFDQYATWLDEWTGMDQAFSFDVNLLSLDHNTVIVPETRSPVLDELDRRGIAVIQTPWRHRYFIKNGIHCCSLETKRKGTAEQYL